VASEITPGGSGATASTSDGNLPANAVDNNLATRWSANGDGQWLQLDLGSIRTVAYVKVAAYNGNARQNIFDIQVSSGSGVWQTILTGARTSGTTTNEDTFDFQDVNARYVRYLGHSNTVNAFNSVTEMSVFGYDCPSCVTPTPQPTVSPTPTPTNTPTPTQPPTPTPTPGGVGNFPPRTFAPYAETWNNVALTSFAAANGGHKFYTLAFIIAPNGGGCSPTWNGDTAIGSYYKSHIDNIRAQGGDVIMSFGGASGTELGKACGTVSGLQAAYQKVIDTYNIRWLDLDIESGQESDTASVDRRNKALHNLQMVNPGLRVSYTLAVDRAGLPSAQINLLKNAKTNTTRVDVVNIMAMDYGPCYTDMGQAAVDAANNTHNQLVANSLNMAVGVTPMINTNDTTCEKFSTTDSQILTNWAQTHSFVVHLAFWSEDRDAPSYPHTKIMHAFH
jgi:chitinase